MYNTVNDDNDEEEDEDEDEDEHADEDEDEDEEEEEEEEDDDDDDEDERKMMERRRMMLRRKTGPKNGKHIVCKPAQSNCTQTFHRSQCAWKFTGQMAEDTRRGQRFRARYTWISHRSHSVCKVTRKMTNALLPPRLNTELQHLPSEPLSVATLFGERNSWLSKALNPAESPTSH